MAKRAKPDALPEGARNYRKIVECEFPIMIHYYMASRQALWQAERKRRGLCIRCGKPRPRDIGSLCL